MLNNVLRLEELNTKERHFTALSIWVETTLSDNDNDNKDNKKKNLQAISRKSEPENMTKRSEILGCPE